MAWRRWIGMAALAGAACGGPQGATTGTIVERCTCGYEQLGPVDGSACETGMAERVPCVGRCPVSPRGYGWPTLVVCVSAPVPQAGDNHVD